MWGFRWTWVWGDTSVRSGGLIWFSLGTKDSSSTRNGLKVASFGGQERGGENLDQDVNGGDGWSPKMLWKQNQQDLVIDQVWADWKGDCKNVLWVSRWPVCSIISEPNLVRLRVGYEIDLQKEEKEKKKKIEREGGLGLFPPQELCTQAAGVLWGHLTTSWLSAWAPHGNADGPAIE